MQALGHTSRIGGSGGPRGEGGVGFAPAGAADRGRGRALPLLLLPLAALATPPTPGPLAASGSPFLARACSLQPSLSFSLSLLLSRWPLGGRWMSGVYTLCGQAGLGCFAGGGGAAVCMWPCFLPVVLGSLGCPPPASQAYVPTPRQFDRVPQPQAENGEGPPITPCHSPSPLFTIHLLHSLIPHFDPH